MQLIKHQPSLQAEYGPFDLHDLDNLGRAGDLYKMSMMIKVDAENRAYVAQRAVGSGFQSVLFADVRSAEDVVECVRCGRADHPKEKGEHTGNNNSTITNNNFIIRMMIKSHLSLGIKHSSKNIPAK